MGSRGIRRHVELEREVQFRVNFVVGGFVVLVALFAHKVSRFFVLRTCMLSRSRRQVKKNLPSTECTSLVAVS